MTAPNGPEAIQERVLVLPRAAANWITTRDAGRSSIAIWRHMVGLSGSADWYNDRTPLDRADFGRCVGLLEQVRSWRPRIYEMAEYARWRPITAAWDTLEKQYLAGGWQWIDTFLDRCGR